jgi:Peptidase family M23
MKNNLFFLLLLISGSSFAQKTETIRFSCPLTDAVEVTEKHPYSLGKELKIILSSPSDTTVRACISGTVTNVQQDEEKKWTVIFNYKNYYFWYSGISRLAVRENHKLKNGDAIGYIEPGAKLELHIFDFETPVDPKKHLDCRLTK